MKKRDTWRIILLLVFFPVFAGETIEELENKLPRVSGEEKIGVLNKLAEEYKNQSPGECIKYGQLALELSKKLNHRNGEATALNYIGIGYFKSGNFKKSLESGQESVKIFQKIDNKKGVGEALYNCGRAYCYLGNYDEALDCFKKSLNIRKKIGEKKDITLSLNSMGIIYRYLNNYNMALKYHMDSLKIQEEIGDKKGIANSLNNIGSIYNNLKLYDKALNYDLESLKIREEIGDKKGIAGSLYNLGADYFNLKDYEKSLRHYLDSLRIFREIGDQWRVTGCFYAIGLIYEEYGQYKKAELYYIRTLEGYEKLDIKSEIANTLNTIGSLYIKLGYYDKALTHLEKGIKIAKEISAKDLIKESVEKLSELFAIKGNYKKALEYHKLYFTVNEEIFNERSSKQIAELQTRYDTLKKEKEIEILKKNNKIQEITRNAFIIGFILVFMILVLIFRKYLHLFSFWKKQRYIGQYRLLEKIGAGGMGTIYKAHSIRDKSKKIALKLLREELFDDESNVKRFEREAKIIDKLEHPNIVKIIERGQYKQKVFIAMELLQGKTLDKKILEEGKMELKQCLKILIQITDALVKIHSENIIHRDLKPENVMLVNMDGDSNFVKLMDFGLAKTKSQTKLTGSGILIGTISYMSPEQITGSEFSPASDIYSLGVVSYEMKTGKKPFHGNTSTDIMRQILETYPIEPIRFDPGMPGELNDLIMRMLEKSASSRPNVRDVLEELKEINLKC